MLWEDDGDIGSTLNYYTELWGDGATMDRLRRELTEAERDREARERAEINRLAKKVKAYKIRKRLFGDVGAVPDFECPSFHHKGYAVAFKMRAQECGIVMEDNGYECWADADFVAWYKKRWPMLCYDEAPRNARILVNEFGKLPREVVCA